MRISKSIVATAIAVFISGHANAELGFMHLAPGASERDTQLSIDVMRTDAQETVFSFTTLRAAFNASEKLLIVGELSKGESLDYAGAGAYYRVYSNKAIDLSLYAWYRQSEKLIELQDIDISTSFTSTGILVKGKEQLFYPGLNWYGSAGIGRWDGIYNFAEQSEREKLASTYGIEVGVSKSMFAGELFGGVEYANVSLDSSIDLGADTSIGIGYRFNIN